MDLYLDPVKFKLDNKDFISMIQVVEYDLPSLNCFICMYIRIFLTEILFEFLSMIKCNPSEKC